MSRTGKHVTTKPANPWASIPPENRPTDERMRHGANIVKNTNGDGVDVYSLKPVIAPIEYEEKGEGRHKGVHARNMESTPIAAAFNRKIITPRQHDAAKKYEQLRDRLKLTKGPRDSLDMSPRGHGNPSDARIAREIDDKAEYDRICRLITFDVHTVVRSVVVAHEPIGDCRPSYRRFRYLCEGLDVLADFWGMPG